MNSYKQTNVAESVPDVNSPINGVILKKIIKQLFEAALVD